FNIFNAEGGVFRKQRDEQIIERRERQKAGDAEQDFIKPVDILGAVQPVGFLIIRFCHLFHPYGVTMGSISLTSGSARKKRAMQPAAVSTGGSTQKSGASRISSQAKSDFSCPGNGGAAASPCGGRKNP